MFQFKSSNISVSKRPPPLFLETFTKKIWYIKIEISQTSCTKEVIDMAQQQQSTNNLVVPGVAQAIDQMKYEIASEFGVQLGPDSTSRANGSVGGEITKRLVQMAEQQLGGYQK